MVLQLYSFKTCEGVFVLIPRRLQLDLSSNDLQLAVGNYNHLTLVFRLVEITMALLMDTSIRDCEQSLGSLSSVNVSIN